MPENATFALRRATFVESRASGIVPLVMPPAGTLPGVLAALRGIEALRGRAPEPRSPGAGVTEGSDLLEGLTQFLLALSAQRPLCLLFDDLQWAEETFLDLVDGLAGEPLAAPVLVLCLARRELLERRANGALRAERERSNAHDRDVAFVEAGDEFAAHAGRRDGADDHQHDSRGRHDDAHALFERLLTLRNDVGLMSEEYDPQACELRAQLLGAVVGGKPRELTPEGLHFRGPIEPEQSPKDGRVVLFEMLGTRPA